MQKETIFIEIDTYIKGWLNEIATAEGKTIEQVSREYLLKGLGHFAPDPKRGYQD